MSLTSQGSLSDREAGAERMTPVSVYRPELDAVRFLAFFLVFCDHVLLRIFAGSNLMGAANARFGPPGVVVLYAVRSSCGMGLCLFFCLSAYLITGILLGESARVGSVSVRRFYLRRVLRIWPLYAFGLLLGVLWAWAFHVPQWSRLLAYMFFGANVYCGAFGWTHNPMEVLWSISVEEQFYLVWPWAMRFLNRRGLWAASIVMLLVANISLFKLGSAHANTDHTVWTNSFAQFEMFAAGIILALLGGASAIRSNRRALTLISTGPILWFIASFLVLPPAEIAPSGPTLIVGYGMAACGCVAILLGFCVLDPAWLPMWTVSLGKISYGLYVYHLLIFTLVVNVLGPFHSLTVWPFLSAMSLLLTIIAAKASYVFLESPFLRLKGRFEILHTRPI